MERHDNDTGLILKRCVILQGSYLKTNFQNSIYYLFYIPDTTLFCAVLVILGCTLEALTYQKTQEYLSTKQETTTQPVF